MFLVLDLSIIVLYTNSFFHLINATTFTKYIIRLVVFHKINVYIKEKF